MKRGFFSSLCGIRRNAFAFLQGKKEYLSPLEKKIIETKRSGKKSFINDAFLIVAICFTGKKGEEKKKRFFPLFSRRNNSCDVVIIMRGNISPNEVALIPVRC